MLLISVLGAILPMLIYLYFLRKFDKNEPEPIKIVILHFFYGATVSVILGVLGSLLFSLPFSVIFSELTTDLLKVILVAPFVEEIAKASLLLKTINRKYVDNLTDGLVYGGAIGLGFGMTENFLYFISFGDTIETLVPLLVMRTIFSAVMHCLSTATVGGIMSLAKYSSNLKRKISIIFSLSIAMFIHFVWNLSVSFSETFIIGLMFMIFIIILFIVVYYSSIRFENKIIVKELSEEIPNNLLDFLSSPFRFKKGWFLQPYQKIFINKSIALAFRKHQVDISVKNRELYTEEIEQLRLDLSKLIELNNNSKQAK